MSVELLKQSYSNVTSKNGLIAFIKEIRESSGKGKYSVTQQRLESLFASSVWKSQHKKGGHLKFEHAITHTIVEYKNHALKGGNIDPGAVITILDSLQKTVNILGNDIFGYQSYNWKQEPDYDAALKKIY